MIAAGAELAPSRRDETTAGAEERCRAPALAASLVPPLLEGVDSYVAELRALIGGLHLPIPVCETPVHLHLKTLYYTDDADPRVACMRASSRTTKHGTWCECLCGSTLLLPRETRTT